MRLERRANVHPSNKRRKIDNHIIIFELECGKKRFGRSEASISVAFGTPGLAPAGKNAMLVVGSVQIASASSSFSSNNIEKPGARIRRKRARKRRMAKVTIQQNDTCPTLRYERRDRAATVDLPSLGKHDVKPMTLAVCTFAI